MVVVSVVVPYLNQERYLAEAIQSVQAQSFSDWELLLVDDGSTDRGPEIAARCAETDRRIRLLKHAEMGNRGVSASRNLGMSRAVGSLIAFLDGDDTFLPDKLATEVSILDKRPEVAVAYGRAIWRYNDGRPDDMENLGIQV